MLLFTLFHLGHNSVHALSRAADPSSTFEDDEYVVYNTRQQRLLYLVHLGPEARPASPIVAGKRSGDSDRQGAKVPSISWLPASHLTAAVLVPSEAISDKVQAIRRVHDPTHVELWPAHVTLLYPFVDPSQLEDAAAIVAKTVLKDAELTMTLKTVGSFDQKKRGHVHYLVPEERGAIQQLARRVGQALGGQFRSAKVKAPHMTIGRKNKVKIKIRHFHVFVHSSMLLIACFRSLALIDCFIFRRIFALSCLQPGSLAAALRACSCCNAPTPSRL